MTFWFIFPRCAIREIFLLADWFKKLIYSLTCALTTYIDKNYDGLEYFWEH